MRKTGDIIKYSCFMLALLLIFSAAPQAAYGESGVYTLVKSTKNIYEPGGMIDTVIIAEKVVGAFKNDEIIEIVLPEGYVWNDDDVNTVYGAWSLAGASFNWLIDPEDQQVLKIFIGANTSADSVGRINIGSDEGGYFAIDIGIGVRPGSVLATISSDKGTIEETEVLAAFHEFTAGLDQGDLNGDGRINSGDAILILRYCQERFFLTNKQWDAADVNYDDVVDLEDAAMILQYYAGFIDSLPGEGTGIVPASGYIDKNSPLDIDLDLTWGTATELLGVRLVVLGVDFFPVEGVDYTVENYGDGTGKITIIRGLEDLLPIPISVVPDDTEFVVHFQFDNGRVLEYTYIVIGGETAAE
ncbi:MAG: hypothetical protein GX581_01475 [Syntrophomonadaceae bacterium]|jgi:hypothetical protein|nr:hypothetical protein [Syntrophomonadaceae bacterium]